MSLDSASKRFSMMNIGSPIHNPLFIPNGTISSGDKYHLLGLYFGITLLAPHILAAAIRRIFIDREIRTEIIPAETRYDIAEREGRNETIR